jgi:5-deoxy-glucuronate isomerase
MSGKTHFLPSETLNRLEPSDMGLKHASAQRFEVKGKVEIKSGDEEVCIVLTSGEFSYTFNGSGGTAEMRDMLYMPVDSQIELFSNDGIIFKFGAGCQRNTDFAKIAFKDVDKDSRHKIYGKSENGTKRDVWNYIDESFDSSRFLMGICSGVDGGWTAWPPHEHAKQREEIYVYFNMGDSFGVQLVYDDIETPYTVAIVKDGHLVAIPKGYHPNCGSPCGGISYIYCMVSVKAEDRSFMDLQTQKIFGSKLE